MIELFLEGRRFSWRVVARSVYPDERLTPRMLAHFRRRRTAERALCAAAQAFMLGTNMPHSVLITEDYAAPAAAAGNGTMLPPVGDSSASR